MKGLGVCINQLASTDLFMAAITLDYSLTAPQLGSQTTQFVTPNEVNSGKQNKKTNANSDKASTFDLYQIGICSG